MWYLYWSVLLVLALDVLGAALAHADVERGVVVVESDGALLAGGRGLLPDEADVLWVDTEVVAEVMEQGAEGLVGFDGLRGGLEVAWMPDEDALGPGVVAGAVAAQLAGACCGRGRAQGLALAAWIGEVAAGARAVVETEAVVGARRRWLGRGAGGDEGVELGGCGHGLVAEEVGGGMTGDMGGREGLLLKTLERSAGGHACVLVSGVRARIW